MWCNSVANVYSRSDSPYQVTAVSLGIGNAGSVIWSTDCLSSSEWTDWSTSSKWLSCWFRCFTNGGRNWCTASVEIRQSLQNTWLNEVWVCSVMQLHRVGEITHCDVPVCFHCGYIYLGVEPSVHRACHCCHN